MMSGISGRQSSFEELRIDEVKGSSFDECFQIMLPARGGATIKSILT